MATMVATTKLNGKPYQEPSPMKSQTSDDWVGMEITT